MAGVTYLFVAVLVVVSSVDASRSEFCKMSTCDRRQHTMCRFASPEPSKRCVSYKSAVLTPPEKKEILRAHNKYRALVASGLETRGLTGPQPAGFIEPLKWDKELALVAQRWANQCSFEHDTCRNVQRFRVGQNIAYGAWSDEYRTNVTEIVKMWYDEVDLFDARLIPHFQFEHSTGHYTQLVWGNTTSIGCGLVRYRMDREGTLWFTTYLVCNYGPAGNYLGEPVYKTH